MSAPALRFEPEGHRYFLGEEEIPSVTRILEPLQELDGVPRATLEAARVFGQHVHKAIALALYKTLDWGALDAKLRPYIEAAKSFIKETDFKVLHIEHRMCDPILRIAGTADLIGVSGRSTLIVDWKTGSTVPRTAGLQLAAYDMLFRRTYGGRELRRLAVHLREDGRYASHPQEERRDLNWFMGALSIYHWQHEAKGTT